MTPCIDPTSEEFVLARKQPPICLGKEENLLGLGEYTNGEKKKAALLEQI